MHLYDQPIWFQYCYDYEKIMPELDRMWGVLVGFVVVRLELGPRFVYLKVLAVKSGIINTQRDDKCT